MDDRQTEIRQGAGLEESRVNQDFLDFLNKWSSPVLMVLAIAALSWAGMQWLQKKKIEKIDRAFGDLDAALIGGNPSPASLRTLASEYAGVKAVPELALLQTVDLYLNAYIRGVEPGALMNPVTGEPTDENDLLDETQRGAYLDQAGQLAQEVIDLTDAKPARAMLNIQGLVRLAVVKESKRDFDGAKALYTRAAEKAKSAGFPTLGNFADNRAAGVDALAQVPALPGNDELTPLPGEELMDIDSLNELINSSMPELESDPVESSDGLIQIPEIVDDATDAIDEAKETVEESIEEAVEDATEQIESTIKPEPEPETP